MSDFDKLIDSLSELSVRLLIDNIYDVLNFSNISKDLVRDIDLKEKLNSLSWCSASSKARMYYRNKEKKIEKVGIETILDYLSLAMNYMNSDVFQCTSNSRAEKYKKYAIDMYNQNKTLSWDLIDDIVNIFVLFLNRTDDHFNNPTDYSKNDISDFVFGKSAFGNVRKFFLQYKTIPKELKKRLCEKKLLHKAKDFVLWENPIDLLYNNDDIDSVLKFMYIYSAIYICRIIQKSGVRVD